MPKSYPEPAKRQGSKSVPGKQDEPSIKFQDLLLHFKNVQARHEKFRRQARGTNSRGRRGKERMSVAGSSSAPLSSGAGNTSHTSMNAAALGRSDGRERVSEGSGGPRSATDRPGNGTRSSSPTGGRMAVGRSRLRKT
ncbi:hypothetical protein NQZ79_g484 [Umbelopsis isabellina]|nr:hypothetical protein NQZ79_g484 [Umbelopsis isabellina]